MIFDRKRKKTPSSRSTKSLRSGFRKNRIKSEGLSPVVGEKSKNETDATFLDVYDVLASKFSHFPHLSKLEVNHASKAKKEAFRERNSQKVKNDSILLHLTLRFLDRDENCFLASSSPKPCANQRFRGRFALAGLCKPNKIFIVSIVVINLIEIQ